MYLALSASQYGSTRLSAERVHNPRQVPRVHPFLGGTASTPDRESSLHDPSMTITKALHKLALAFGPLTLGLTSSAAFAQDVQAPERVPATDAAAPQDAKALRPDRPFVGHSAIVGIDLKSSVAQADGEPLDLGDISDFVVNGATGQISYVVISSGGVGEVGHTLRTVAWDMIAWGKNDDGAATASVQLNEEQFTAIPEFKVENLEMLTGRGAVEAAAKRAGDAAKDWTDEEKDAMAKKAREAMGKASKTHLATSINGLGIYGPAGDKAFASVGELIIDAERGAVAFTSVEANDVTILMPFQAIELKATESDSDAKPEYRAMVSKGEADLAGAPAVDDENNMNASNPRFRAATYTFFGIEDPAQAKGKGKKGMGAKAVGEVKKAKGKRGTVKSNK